MVNKTWRLTACEPFAGYSRETSLTESTWLVCRHTADLTLLSAVGGDMERYQGRPRPTFVPSIPIAKCCNGQKMPLQNRVDPLGALFRSPARGTFMGNRGGALHNDHREIVREYKSRQWITCVLEFKGRRRAVMSPRRYTELFFLDEAVGFAAGHRPCAECRRQQFNAFKLAWMQRYPPTSSYPIRASQIDEILHRARLDDRKRKRTYEAPLRSLPNGSFVQIDQAVYLVWDDALALWTPEGYGKTEPRPHNLTVTVLTPRPIVECFVQGYEPEIHRSFHVV